MGNELPFDGLAEMAGLGNFQPFNASGNIYQITRLKRRHNTLCGHLEGGISLLLPENVFD
jgi:hypothetical protein